MMIQQNPKDDAELVWVPGGTFIMGSDPDEIRGLWRRNNWDDYWLEKDGRVRSELSPLQVKVAGFWMYRDLIMIEQYFRFMQETEHPAPVDQSARSSATGRRSFPSGEAGHSVVMNTVRAEKPKRFHQRAIDKKKKMLTEG